jgi:tetratricopeptide (TPR) repeat protein
MSGPGGRRLLSSRRVVAGAAALAVALLVPACGSSSSSTSDALQRGLEAQAAGRLADADADYLSVIRTQPDNKVAWYDLGVIAQQRQEAGQAQHDYLEALHIDDRYVPALYNLALIEAVESPPTAVKLYEQVTGLEPSDAPAHANLGTLLVAQGRTAAGRAQLTRAYSLDPALAQRTLPAPPTGGR